MEADSHVHDLRPGQCLLLENVRFYKDESSKQEEDRIAMAKKIASYGDLYVSDAFGTAHRNSATSKFLIVVGRPPNSFFCQRDSLTSFFILPFQPQ